MKEAESRGDFSVTGAEPAAEHAGPSTLLGALAERPGAMRRLQRRIVQRRLTSGGGAAVTDPSVIQSAAGTGISGAGAKLPHLDTIQRAFGHHDASRIEAHTDHAAAQAARTIGAEAFASGEHVAFRGLPSLHTAAHEAAHVIQQRAGVHLKGGVGEAGDAAERQADAVADEVVKGGDASALLDEAAGPGPRGARQGVQRKLVLARGKPALSEQKARSELYKAGLDDGQVDWAINKFLNKPSNTTIATAARKAQTNVPRARPGNAPPAQLHGVLSDSKTGAPDFEQKNPFGAMGSGSFGLGGLSGDGGGFGFGADEDQKHNHPSGGFRFSLGGGDDDGEDSTGMDVRPDSESKHGDSSSSHGSGDGPSIGPTPKDTAGGMGLIRRPSFIRQDSRDTPYLIPGTAMHQELRGTNETNNEAAGDEGTADETESGGRNFLSVGLTISYRTSSGSIQTWQQAMPQAWMSGYGQKFRNPPLADEEAVPNLTDFFLDEKGELAAARGDGAGLNKMTVKGKSRAFRGKNSKKNSARLAHSETAFASDPHIQDQSFFVDMLNKFQTSISGEAKKGGVALLSVVLDADSYPNTVCKNACRPALAIAQGKLDACVREFYGADNGRNVRLSGKYATDERVGSARAYPMHLTNHDHLGEEAGGDPPLVSGGGQRFEVLAGQSTVARPGAKKVAKGKAKSKHEGKDEKLPGSISTAEVAEFITERGHNLMGLDPTAFWRSIEALLGRGARDQDKRNVLALLQPDQMRQLLKQLKIDQELVLGYEGALSPEALKLIIWFLLSVLKPPPDPGKKGPKPDDPPPPNNGSGPGSGLGLGLGMAALPAMGEAY